VKPKFCLIPLFVDSGECYDPGAAMKKKGGVNDAALSQALAEPELPQKRINWDLPSQSFRMECPGPAGLFVQLSPDRRRFELDGSPFFFTGCNSYYLMTRAPDPGLQQQVLEVLDDAKAAGLTVVRTWAFNDGPEWNALQPAPGQWSTTLLVVAAMENRNATLWLDVSITIFGSANAFVATLCVLSLAGQFDERVFVGLDFVLAEAARRGLKVLLALTNYWTPFGGMTQYVK